jgi:hypothetical protein
MEMFFDASNRVVAIFGAIRASRVIHKKLLVSILGSTFRYDYIPIARRACVSESFHPDGSTRSPPHACSPDSHKTF